MGSSSSLVPGVKRRAFLGRAVQRYEANVDSAEQYLTGRGITLDVAREWRLGVAVDPLPGHDNLGGRLTIPYLTPTGPVGLVGRCLRQHNHKEVKCAKYLTETGERRRLFNVADLHRDTRSIVIAEGELDALACNSLAGVPAVGVPGANNWQAHWVYLFDAYEDVIVCGDSDDAGSKLIATIKGALSNVRAVTMPPGADVNSFIVTNGADAFRDHIGWEGE